MSIGVLGFDLPLDFFFLKKTLYYEEKLHLMN